jgi:hypothetical protein
MALSLRLFAACELDDHSLFSANPVLKFVEPT